MRQTVDDQEQMEQLRELIKVLLGVAAIKEDVADIVSELFKLFHKLEVRCPQLSCHFHVSGVSQRTGDTFFVVVYDAAIMASVEAKRVIKAVYTHLHSETSMVMTSALFRNSLARSPRLPSGSGAQVPAAAAPVANNADTMGASGNTSAHIDNLPQANGSTSDGATGGRRAAIAGALQPLGNGQQPDPAALRAGGDDSIPNAKHLHAHDAREWAPPGGEGVVEQEAEGRAEGDKRLALVASAPPSLSAAGATELGGFAGAGVGFAPPAVHVPSEKASAAVEDLFTAVKGGWVGILRSTLSAVLLALVAFRGLPSKASLQGMLVWWPLAMGSRNGGDGQESATRKRGRRGPAGDRLMPHPFPVEVQRRHNPPGERRRDALNVEDVDYIALSEVAPARSHLTPINEVVAMLLLLFDKEKAVVAPVFDQKLAEHGITRKEPIASRVAGAPTSVTVADVLARTGFGGAGLSDKHPSPSATDADASAAASQLSKGAEAREDVSAAVAARLKARRAAGVASQRALAAYQTAEAERKAQRLAAGHLKRSGGAAVATTSKKRPRVGSALLTRSDALAAEFKPPNLQPREDGPSSSVLLEASLLSGHTYTMLATNWPPLQTDAHVPEYEILTATDTEWSAIVEMQETIVTVMEEGALRRARKDLMAKADEIRGAIIMESDQQPCVYVKVAARGDAGEVKLTSATLQAMIDLHTAAMRVQTFRVAVEWLSDAAGYTSARVPDFSGVLHVSNAALANEVLTALADCHPISTVWRLPSEAAVGAEQKVVIPAYLLVKNAQDVCMTDDIITVNTIILARWCLANRPDDFWVLHCSFFVELLSADERGVASLADRVETAAGRATTLMGVCNIGNAHWITLGVHVPSKTVWLYDSGAHFLDLKNLVQAASKQMQVFGKVVYELRDELEQAKEADAVVTTVEAAKVARAVEPSESAKLDVAPNAVKEVTNGEGGGPLDVSSAAERVDEAAGSDAAKAADVDDPVEPDKPPDANRPGKKPWTTRRVKVPAQTDCTSCGPFAFSFLWHKAHGVQSNVLSCDAFALRMTMVAAIVRDGRELEVEAPPAESEALARPHESDGNR